MLLDNEDLDDILGNVGGFLFHVIQDLVAEMWARSMASAMTSALLVACHHVVVLLALCFLLIPIGIWASLVAHLVPATR